VCVLVYLPQTSNESVCQAGISAMDSFKYAVEFAHDENLLRSQANVVSPDPFNDM